MRERDRATRIEDAKEAVAEMKARALTPLLVTGDNRRTAMAVARELGIDGDHAEVLPRDKAGLVGELRHARARPGGARPAARAG